MREDDQQPAVGSSVKVLRNRILFDQEFPLFTQISKIKKVGNVQVQYFLLNYPDFLYFDREQFELL